MRCSRPALLALLLPALALSACGGDKEEASADKPPAETAASTPAATESATEPAGEDFSKVKDGECAEVDWPSPKDPGIDKPTGSLDPAKKHTVTMQTSCGEFVIELAAKAHPKTANAFGYLAKEGYFNGTGFHRVVPELIIQGGDPSGDGTGGPNWEVVEAPSSSETYKRGTVAMAKTAAAPAGATGSQFFIVTAPVGGYPPEYAVAGKVVSGMDVVDAINGLAASGDGPPSRAAVIGKATLKSGG